jgi:uncharacterized membrane protein
MSSITSTPDQQEPPSKAQGSLFHYVLHPHRPQNVNLVFEAEKAAGNFNRQVAVRMTTIFQAMPTFWLIMAWIVLWIVVNATIASFDPLPWPLLLTLASVPQLPLMIVILVGQGLLGRRQELQSEEQFNTTQKTYHDIEQVMLHLSEQDAELLKQTGMLVRLLQSTGIAEENPANPVGGGRGDTPDATKPSAHSTDSAGSTGSMDSTGSAGGKGS